MHQSLSNQLVALSQGAHCILTCTRLCSRRSLFRLHHSTSTAGFPCRAALQIHFCFSQLPPLRFTLNKPDGGSIGSVALTIWIFCRKSIKKDMPQMRIASVAYDLQATKLCFSSNVASRRGLGVVALIKNWPSAVAPEL